MSYKFTNPAIRLSLQKDKSNNIQISNIFLYRMIQEKTSIFWGTREYVIFEKNKVRRNTCVILNEYLDGNGRNYDNKSNVNGNTKYI